MHVKKTTIGFTLIEVLVAISILFIISAAAITMYHGLADIVALRDGTATVLHALEEGRNRAAVGVGEGDHGVYVEEDRITVFEGSDPLNPVPGTERTIFLPSAVATDQTVGTAFIFSRLSGESSSAGTITLTHEDGETAAISVTYDGIISYEE